MKNGFNWNKVRKNFGLTKELAYFQSAGMSPISEKVLKTIEEAYEKIYLYGDIHWSDNMEQIVVLREMLGKIMNTTGENISILPNTSTAFSLVALSLKKVFGEDLNLITTQDEFPATNVPFEYQGIQMKYAQPENGRYPVEEIIELAGEHTRGIVCSYVQYGTGFRQDLTALGKAAREKGLLFIVNATQGYPIFPIDVEKMNIDVLSATLLKWGCAANVGSVFYTSPDFRRRFPAPIAGWLSVMPPADDFIPTAKGKPLRVYPEATQYNFGSSNLQVLLGLKAAIELMEEIGWERIRKRILVLTDKAIAGLMQIDEVEILSPHSQAIEQSGIISINLKGYDNTACVEYLQKAGVITSIRQHNIRISCNFFNNEEDIDRLVQGIFDFMKQAQAVR